MKTENKMIASLEMAVVLCSVLLVAIPAIAAEQNQEMQEVSASTITTASEDDYVLEIYGNANEDDTIDMRDLTYVKLIFFGKTPETELADAKYDGKINPLDFIQIKLIIVGKEKELTIVDQADRIVTVKKPIKRVCVVPIGIWGAGEAIRTLGVQDKIVGVSIYAAQNKGYYPKLSKLPSFAHNDYEAMLSLTPDLVITFSGGEWATEAAEKLPDVTVVGFSVCYSSEEAFKGMMLLGYIFDKEDEARHYLDDFVGKLRDNFIKVRTEGLSEEDRPKVYEEASGRRYKVFPALVEAAGGRDIFADLPKRTIIDPEAVIAKNPDIIIKKMKGGDSGYDVDDLSKAKVVRDEMMNRPELANVNAVKDGRVYVISGSLCYGLKQPIAIAYYAKWFYPELFEDLNPKAIHKEFLIEFQGLDIDLDKKGVFVYPPEEHPDGQ